MTDMRGRNTILSRIWYGGMLAVAGLIAPTMARADVVAQTDNGFVSRTIVAVDASPATVWKRLVDPAVWWSSDHTFSGDAANLSLDPVAGGCFCERLPGETKPGETKGGRAAAPRGGVQHMRVVFVDQTKALRLIGALGPLQSEAVNATLTITLKPVGKGTRILFEYVVGGYMRYPIDKISDAVDTMLGGQMASLAKPYAAIDSGETPAPTPVPNRRAEPDKADSGGGLAPEGLLVPRGRIWSLPPSGPATPPVPASAPQPAPRVQDDTPPADVPAQPPTVEPAKTQAQKAPPAKSRQPKPRPAPKPVPEPQAESQPAQSEVTLPDSASPAPPPPAPERPARQRPAKAARPAPATAPDEPSKADVNSAFDQVLGGSSPAPVTPP